MTSSYPSRRSTSLRGYDYSQAGAYFVTLCTEGRLSLLGSISDSQMHPSPAGEMVADVWSNLGHYYPADVDAFVVMPNHLHGILLLQTDGNRSPTPTPTMSLSTIIQRFKTFTVHEYGKGVAVHQWPRYPGRLWQHRYHDHVIRNPRDLDALREYIDKNPLQWQHDRENPDRWR